MSQIRYKNTVPEVTFRRLLWSRGLRGYWLNSNITGKPDIYFSRSNMVIFIDGCFWHKCPKCFVKPKSNLKYWNNKIKRNVKRDKEVNSLLQKSGIRVIRIWEHEIFEDIDKAYEKVRKEHER